MISRQEIKERASAAFTGRYWLCVGIFAILGWLMGSSGGLGAYFGIMAFFLREAEAPIFISVILMVYALVISGVSVLYYIFLGGPFAVSAARVGLSVYDEKRPRMLDIFFCFREGRYWKSVGAMALNFLYTSLAGLIVVVPAALAAIILAVVAVRMDDPDAGMTISTIIMILAMLGSFIPIIIVGIGLSQTPYVAAEDGLSGKEAVRRSWELMRGHKAEYFGFLLSFFGWFMLTLLSNGVVGVFYAGPYINTATAGYYRELTTVSRNYTAA